MDIIDTSFYTEYDLADTTASKDATIAYENFGITAGDDGTFSSNPKATITFTTTHSSIGFTIKFSDSYPTACTATWYNLSGELMTSESFTISSQVQFFSKAVDNYGKIVIEFTKGVAGKTVNISSIEYGITKSWDETVIGSGTLVEQQDMISDQLPINTLDFEVLDENSEFNLGNENGAHQFIQPLQVIRPYEYIRGTKHYLGKYFLDTYSYDENVIKFSAVNYMGLLDKITYYKGDVYNGTTAGTIIDSIMKTAGVTDYTVDDETYATPMYGALKPMTCREALREVLFTSQSVVNVSRNDKIEIYKRTNSVSRTLDKSVKISTKATKKEYVSGIEIKYNEYTLDSDTSEILTGSYDAGDNLITFDSPYADITTSAGIIKESGKFYCILTLTATTAVTISGKQYNSNSFSVTYNTTLPESGEPINIKSLSSELANHTLAYKIATDVMDYYNYRLQLDIEFLADTEDITQWYEIENPEDAFSNYLAGFESISTDLTNGFVSTATMSGYYNYKFSRYYAGDELYGDDNFIL